VFQKEMAVVGEVEKIEGEAVALLQKKQEEDLIEENNGITGNKIYS
jgi:hypothetical protein